MTGVTGLSAGETHACAVVAGGKVRCWGSNDDGELGDGNEPVDRRNPVAVCADATCSAGLAGAGSVAAGGHHTCAMFSASGSVACWGNDSDGQLGDGGGGVASDTPRNVCRDAACSGPITGVLSGGVDLGFGHTCTITTDSNVGCFGANFYGQLGDGNAPNARYVGGVNVVGLDTKTGDGPVTVDTAGNVGQRPSIALDGAGNPVVSYRDQTNEDLKIVHCGNPSCSAGNIIASPDTTGIVGGYPSLELDASGYPVVSYHDTTNQDLKVLHCGNAFCTAGNSIASPDTAGSVGAYSSLELDAGGNPVVSYYDGTNLDLKVLDCGNSTCTAGNVISSPVTAGNVGNDTSLVLNASGDPVVSFTGDNTGTPFDVTVLTCGNAACTAGNTTSVIETNVAQLGFHTSIALDGSGNPVVSFNGDMFTTIDYLKVARCGNATCTSGNTVVTVDVGSGVGKYSSLALDATGFAVVSYFHEADGTLKLLHCGNAACTSDNTIGEPDPTLVATQVTTSLVLDTLGNPVISYHDAGAGSDLKVVHCNDPSCSGSDAPPPVTAFVGTGADGDCASGPATTCALDGPRGMYSSGQVTYLADGDNCRVKKVEDGTVTTIAGLGPSQLRLR